MTLQKLREVLLSFEASGVTVKHFFALGLKAPYIIWAEDGAGRTREADDRIIGQVITGTIDYFTEKEYDPFFEELQDALSDNHIPWRLNSIQYEDETKLIHYEWAFEVIGWQR